MAGQSKKEAMANEDILVQLIAADFGKRLHEARDREGLPQTMLAEMIQTKHPRVSNLEGGLVDVRISDIVKLARALDVNPGTLLDLTAYELKDYPPSKPPSGHARPYRCNAPARRPTAAGCEGLSLNAYPRGLAFA